MVRNRTVSSIILDIGLYVLMTVLSLVCILPLVHVLSVSLSDRAATTGHLVSLWPVNFTTASYAWLIKYPLFRVTFMNSVIRVLLGTTLTVIVTVLTAYPLSLPTEFPGKKIVRWMLIISMIFSGGLIPWFLVMKNLHLLNSIWGLVLYGLVSPFLILITLNFFRGLPIELSEAAVMDGASHWDILFKVYLPVSLPVLATVTLFVAVFHWNAWFDGLILISNVNHRPLQSYLQTILISDQQGVTKMFSPELFRYISDRSLRSAQIFISTIPILLIYPILQRFFVHGLTLGSVKG